jgi:ankyrin repeat protein
MKKLLILIILAIPVSTFAQENLRDAVDKGDIVFIKNYKGNINRPLDKEGWTALMLAAVYSKPDVANALIASGADLNAAARDGKTVLMVASLYGQADMVKILIKAGANINFMNKKGETALSLAVRFKYNNIAELLKKAGAK